jgi:hypothetical protein
MYCRGNVEKFWRPEIENNKQRLCIKTHVSLVNREHVSIKEGYVSTKKVGDVLHTPALLEDEVVVTVIKVLDGKCGTL